MRLAEVESLVLVCRQEGNCGVPQLPFLGFGLPNL